MHNMPGYPDRQFRHPRGRDDGRRRSVRHHRDRQYGHAAKPHEAIDTTLVAAQIVVALQSIVSRNLDPLKKRRSRSVVETDSTAHNVIPQVVKLKGTARSLAPEVRDQLGEGSGASRSPWPPPWRRGRGAV